MIGKASPAHICAYISAIYMEPPEVAEVLVYSTLQVLVVVVGLACDSTEGTSQ